jgi:hypothetical protein
MTPLYPQKLALTSTKSGGRLGCIVRSWTQATELFLQKVPELHKRVCNDQRIQGILVNGKTTYLMPYFLVSTVPTIEDEAVFSGHRNHSPVTRNRTVFITDTCSRS